MSRPDPADDLSAGSDPLVVEGLMMSLPLRVPASGLRARIAAFLTVLATGAGVVMIGVGPAHASQHAITITQYRFTPASMSIHQGDTITWTNQDTVGHDVEVTSGPASFHSPMLSKGQSWSFTFAAAGTYSYICSVHPDMKATVAVAAAPQQASPPEQQPVPDPAAAGTAPTATDPAPSATPTTASAHARSPRARGTAGIAETQTAPASAAAVVTPGSDAALDPLLLVAGVAVAVVVFCLLLMTARPEQALLPSTPRPVPPAAGGAHSADTKDFAEPS